MLLSCLERPPGPQAAAGGGGGGGARRMVWKDFAPTSKTPGSVLPICSRFPSVSLQHPLCDYAWDWGVGHSRVLLLFPDLSHTHDINCLGTSSC